MKIERLYNELNEIIYFMNALEILKKNRNKKSLIDSKKTLFLFESTIDEIITRSQILQKKIDKNLSYQEHKIFIILTTITNNWITKNEFKEYTFNHELKKVEKTYKYPIIYILELTNFLLFFKKKLKTITNLDGIYLNDNNAIEELLKIYEEEINFEKNRTPEYLDILKEKQNECLKILNKLKRDEKQNEKNKYIYDYKYPIKTKHSIVTVKNKKNGRTY